MGVITYTVTWYTVINGGEKFEWIDGLTREAAFDLADEKLWVDGVIAVYIDKED